jgi:hypothetical protein
LSMRRIHAQFIKELRRTFERPDWIDSDFSRCYVRFLYRAHMIGH